MDVLLTLGPDGGEIECVNGQLVMDGGLKTAVILSLAGGNLDDSGSDGDKAARKDWWGNHDELDPAFQYRSQFQHAVDSKPLIPVNLRAFHEAAAADLEWLTKDLAKAFTATCTITARNRIKLDVKIDGTDYAIEFAKTN